MMIVQMYDCAEAYQNHLSAVFDLIPISENHTLLERAKEIFWRDYQIKVIGWEALEFKDREHFTEWFFKWT